MEVKEIVKRFCHDEGGLELTEYAIMLALIVVGLLTVIGLLSGKIEAAFQAVVNMFTSEGL